MHRTHRVRSRSRRPGSSNSSSPSESSSSSSSDSGSSSSDDCAAPERPANKLERLRRIFLSQPSGRTSRSPQSHRHNNAPSLAARSRAFKSPGRLQSRRGSSVISGRHEAAKDEKYENDDLLDSSTDEDNDKQTSQLSIDNHVHSLCEQVKCMMTQRKSTASQLHAMLDQAIEELQFLKRQEERSLQSHVKQIQEDFGLRLEVFEQQYEDKVADIQREMQRAIQQQRTNAEATILAAAKKLHEKTQAALLPPSSLVGISNASLAAASSQTQRLSGSNHPGDAYWPGNQSHRFDDFRSLSLNFGRKLSSTQRKPSQGRYDDAGGDEADSELSPVEKQKAKLRALEAKLASFSQDSVERITSELKGGGLRKSSSTRQPERATGNSSSQHPANELSPTSRASAWKPTPLSPLRKNRSYWRRGISLEAKANENDWMTTANTTQESVERAQKKQQKAATTPLNSRFLRPEEEQELRHLRNSIGLAKDWMERHH